MCGIAGLYHFASGRPAERLTLERMTTSLTHRGPDDEGYHYDGALALGFRRLSIIDLTGGHQPMSDAEETVWVVFNGEIYNFPELRAELEGLGHVFRTASDTEVIVHGYKQWGQEVLQRLNGMFGLAVWDVRRRRLTIARDAFGIKLVYYRIAGGTLTFASEVRALAAAAGESFDVDPAALNLFLRYRFTPSPYTLYHGVRKLAAGTMLTCENGECRVSRWYRSRPAPVSPLPSRKAAAEELAHLYRGAVRRHLLSDVPVGLLLSGGLDSGLLLALMNLYGASWRTYTAGYGASFRDDELADAEDTAHFFGARHTAVRLERESFEAALPKIVSCLEEPIASSSIVPMYFVCQRARADVKVALMGQGPDELFGGYRRHLGVRYSGAWRRLPGWLRAPVRSTLRGLPRNETLKRGVYALDITDRLRRYEHVLSLAPGHEVDGLFADGLLNGDAGELLQDCWSDLHGLMDQTDELGGFQFLELRSTLPDELLMYADKLSMAHSLEVRVPYLDREVVEYVERLPADYKVHFGSRKWLHRQVCRQLLPARVLRRRKRGFAVNVVDQWFRGALGSRLDGMIRDSGSLMYRHLQPRRVQQLLAEHRSGAADNHKLLFSLVVFEQWLRNQSAMGIPAV